MNPDDPWLSFNLGDALEDARAKDVDARVDERAGKCASVLDEAVDEAGLVREDDALAVERGLVDALPPRAARAEAGARAQRGPGTWGSAGALNVCAWLNDQFKWRK